MNGTETGLIPQQQHTTTVQHVSRATITMAPPKEKPKTKRKSISIQTKQEIISMRDKGFTPSDIMKKFDLSSSTVATIYSAQGRSTVKKALDEKISMQATKVKGALFFLKWLYIDSKLVPYMPKNNNFPI